MNYRNIDLTDFAAAHAQGLRDRELAARFRVGLETVRRRRAQLGLGSNCPNNNKGRHAEALVTALLTAQGAEVQPQAYHAHHDLLVNGWRVDVKAGRTRVHRKVTSLEFRLPERRNSNLNTASYPKDYQQDTDFFALVAFEGDRLTDAYVLPVSLWQPSITMQPGSEFCPYQPYRDAWAQLSPAAGVAV